jgi:hypothetical protein
MTFKVSDEYRKNELSLSPGGSEVTSILANGKSTTYDKVKNITAYCNRLKADPKVMEIKIDGNTYWKRNP